MKHNSQQNSYPNSYRAGPDDKGFFGQFGGQFAAETLMPALQDLEACWTHAKHDSSFWQLVESYFEHYIGRPSPLWRAERLTAALGGATLWFKRDELNHTGCP